MISTKFVDVDVDTSNDFMLPEGALPAPDVLGIHKNTKLLTNHAYATNRLIISLVDRHFDINIDREELATYGVHAMHGTWGQEKIPESLLSIRYFVPSCTINLNTLINTKYYNQVIFGKQGVNGFFSKENPAGNRNIEAAVKDIYHVKKAIFRGVLTDICVVINLYEFLRLEVECYLVTDAIRALDQEAGQKAIDKMEKDGVHLVTTDWVIKNVR